ncbi:hypothetical protein BASA50_003960 [Batrachochytrium salamandrivorans]|uniref:Uncharacterized protein n=1 Tax=Batrachochytrium salamandrivorans TaxID=1357716 RepID=A0ABQ8FGV2_9FUNG|nr:hypothetical protein BASA62_005919 [Batrachochytrium salamandrivorans]KAH6582050.1 hypothetical protein BASA60_002164 [Batrachochytrium salamandrivorans]KAH6598078.1 hypothetical protein BASA50_003960 [Batrachochytrium salamandrivorans]KAH9272485.1 hypothetical protein BASA83_005294 [Batrachochytrium salamandrivorans]
MKLISFVAISFLAITVSAQAPQKYSYKSLRASQSPRQFSQAEILVELKELTAAYEEEKKIFAPIESIFRAKGHEYAIIHNRMMLTDIRSEETGLDRAEKSKRQKEYHNAVIKWEAFGNDYDKIYPGYKQARIKYNNARAVLYLLTDNQERIRIHNTENQVQTGSSFNSLYNMGILKHQLDEMLERLALLLAKLKSIKYHKATPGNGLTDQRFDLRGMILFRKTQCKLAKDILQDYERSQPMGVRFMKFINSRLPNTQI